MRRRPFTCAEPDTPQPAASLRETSTGYGPRTDEGHIAAQNVAELRLFIKAGLVTALAVGLQISRMPYEERVLSEEFPACRE
jgi:hypothetical protein